MRTRIVLPLLLLLLGMTLTATAGPLQQTGAEPPPTIITFDVDLPAITVAEAESGQSTATLSWMTLGIGDDALLALQAYRLNTWESLVPAEDLPLEPAGEREVPVLHPYNFGPPTYRLVIFNGDGRILDERVLVIPYDIEADEAAPAIEDFATTVQSVSESALLDGTARVMVSWEVSNRTPTSNLVFQQVLPDARLASVELPRPNLWVGSTGEGPLAPIYAEGADRLQLRLQLVDLRDGTVYDQRTLAIPVLASAAATVPPTSAPTGGGTGSQPTIVTLTVSPNPVERGGMVTVSWQVQDASRVHIYRTNPVGQFADFLTDQPPAGAWTLTLPDYHVDSAQFYLEAEGANGSTADASVSVQVICPYTYFFGDPGQSATCPRDEAATVDGAWQAFESGFMLWRGDTNDILVLANDGSVSVYPDTWQDGETFDVGETPPAGLVQPVRGFGKVWAENESVREALGWAFLAESGYAMQIQVSGAYRYPNTYISWPDGQVITIVETTWAFLSDIQ
ncbi:MAG: hypothetical protein JW910_21395 [Anaerolineae bacterium]|nr:hypothetical protein [Anaerolineae bacterium]